MRPGRVVPWLCAALAAGALTMVAAPTQAAAPADLVTDGSINPPLLLARQWPTYAGALSTSLVGANAVRGRSMTVPISEVSANIPRFGWGRHQSGRGAYAWVACNSMAFFIPNARMDPADCTVVGHPPEGTMSIVDGQIAPTGVEAWRPLVNNSLFGETVTYPVQSTLAGLYVGLKYVVEALDGGRVSARTYGTSSSALVLPYNFAPAVTPVLLTAPPVAGRVVTAKRANWRDVPPNTRARLAVDNLVVCDSPAAAADTRETWVQDNGCRILEDPNADLPVRPPLEARLTRADAGKYLLIQSVLYLDTARADAGLPLPAREMFSLTHRTPALRIGVIPADLAGGAVDPAPPAPDPADGGGAAADPAASGGDAQNPAPPAGGGGASAESGSDAAAAIGAGVDLAAAPLADANGQGVGAAAGLTMQVAASSRVNRGRRITVKAVVTPKMSQGVVRMTLVRFNPKGQAKRGTVFTKRLRRGEAVRRWRVAKSYQPGAFTLVVTYVPKQAGAPGITRTLPVTVG